MRSVDYDWYAWQIIHCDYLSDADALMDRAAEDPAIDAGNLSA